MNKQDKYNPDINKKYELLTRERDNLHYNFSNQVYKGITNNFPTNVSKPEDLKIVTDEPDYDKIKSKMEDALKEREKEKIEQEELLKNLSNKSIQKKMIISSEKTSNVIESHQDMKNSYQKFTVKNDDKLKKEKLILNDVLDLINNIK
jgi:hypothetical protein